MTARVSLITITNISAKKLVNLKYEAVADFETEEQRLQLRTLLLFSITNRHLAESGSCRIAVKSERHTSSFLAKGVEEVLPGAQHRQVM